MIIKAIVKLQSCRTNARQAFVGRDRQEHGIAKGPVRLYEVTAPSWAGVRRVLKTFDVMGHSGARMTTVESYTEDIGTAYAALREVK